MSDPGKKDILTGLEIAVIGMAVKFPGAKNIAEFWSNLENGVESISFFSDEELVAAGIEPGLIENPRFVKAVGIVEDVEYFDSAFFGYSPAEADVMDPQMRVFHQCAWTALENSGYEPESYNGLIGLYAGSASGFNWEAATLISGKQRIFGGFAASLLARKDYMCHRVSYKLNLKGPVFTVYTACSTSLAAIHLACQGLLTGECDAALAGGVTITFPQGPGYLYQEGMIQSPDGHCRAFDARANGTIGGNGAGIVMLKRLNDAVSDGDSVYAVIKGSAINNDGSGKVGFTAPSINGQAQVIRAAQQMAEVEPESISYIETHGTGTPLGDPIEINALKSAFNTNKKAFCSIGSVKTNLGHLDTAAGVAGFIKTVLALTHRFIPPSLNFESPNPGIDLENSPFYVNSEPREWKNSKYPLRAGVSSFGIGGTNVHVVLEEPPEFCKKRVSSPPRQQELILISAKTPAALTRATKNLSGYLQENNNVNLADVAYTLQVGRRVLQHRRMVLCSTFDQAVNALTQSANQNQATPPEQQEPGKDRTFFSKEDDRPVIFMFPGQGAQYVNMGLDLYKTEPLFRNEINRCFEILKPLMGYDIKEILYPGEGIAQGAEGRANEHQVLGVVRNAIDQTEITQPLLFAFEYALAKLLIKWGIKPAAMIGHSIGEYVAACLAGVFSLEDALSLVALRGKLMQQMPEGSMVSVPLSEEELKPLLKQKKDISLAAVNSPCSCVISGPNEAVADFATYLKAKGYEIKSLHTSHAFHSHMINPMLKAFAEKVKQIPLNKPLIRYVSNVSGKWITNEQAVNPAYWVRHLRQTVRFSHGVKELLIKEDNSLFLEIGPGTTLTTFIKQHKHKEEKNSPLVTNLVRHPKKNVSDESYLLSQIGYLWLTGVRIDWHGFYSGEKRYRIALPTYPFESRRSWPDMSLTEMMKTLWAGTTRQYEPLSVEGPAAQQEEEESGETQLSETIMQRQQLSTPYIAPGNETEQTLVNIWQRFFGIKKVGIRDDFFELGGESLQAMAVANTIHKDLNVRIPMPYFFANPFIEKLAQYIVNDAKKDTYSPIEPVEKKEYYHLSPVQKRLFFLHQVEGGTNYNMPVVVSLEGELDREVLEESFKRLIKRHENFRMSFELIEGEASQKIHEDVRFEISYYETGEEEAKEMVKNFVRPFDFTNAPLIKVGLIKLDDATGKHILMMDMHHSISDGTSMGIFFKELMVLYKGEELPVLRIQYKDYAEWLIDKRQKELLKKEEDYWLKQFEAKIPVMNLPTDYPRPRLKSFEGGSVNFDIGKEESDLLRVLMSEESVTLYMVLMSIYSIFLSKLGGQEDIVVGTVINGRSHNDLEQVMGMFVNTLFLRNNINAEKTFVQLLQEVKKRTLEAFENQHYQTDALVEKVAVGRDPARHPLTDVGFTLQNFNTSGLEIRIPGLKLEPYGFKNEVSLADLALITSETGDHLFLRFEYCKKLFKTETIERFVKYYKEVLAIVVKNKNIKLKEIKMTHDLLVARSTVAEINFSL